MKNEKDTANRKGGAPLLAAFLAALALAPLARADEGVELTDSERWNKCVDLYRSGDSTNALEALRMMMNSPTHGGRAAELVAKLEFDAASRAATPAEVLKRREEAAAAAQTALRADPKDRRLNANFTRAVDGLEALRDARHVEDVVKASEKMDPAQALKGAAAEARRLLAESAGNKTNEAVVAVRNADAMAASAAKLSDVWIAVKAKASEAAAMSAMQGAQGQPGRLQQPGQLQSQPQGQQPPGLEETLAAMDKLRERTVEASRLLGDMDDDARYALAEAEGGFTDCYKAVVLPPAAIRDDQVCQSNAWLDVAEECGRPWQKEALDYTKAFRAKFDQWAKAYEQQAASNTNAPPFTAEMQEEVRKLSAQLEKIQEGCCKTPSPPDQEEALRIIARIIELIPKQGGGGGDNDCKQGADGDNKSKGKPDGDDKKDNKDDGANDKDPGKDDDNKDQEKPEDDKKDDKKEDAADEGDEKQPTPEEKEIEAVLKKAQERNDEHEAQKRARARKARLPPNERDW